MRRTPKAAISSSVASRPLVSSSRASKETTWRGEAAATPGRASTASASVRQTGSSRRMGSETHNRATAVKLRFRAPGGPAARSRIASRVSAIVDTPEQAAALERPPLLVRRPLEAYLDGYGLGSGPVEAEPVGEGHSNITYLIRRAGGRWILRRPPRPPLPPSAHDVLREARLLRALQHTAARVPKVLAVAEDPDVIGAPFYVMEVVEGAVATTAVPAPLDAEPERRRMADELIDALAEIHAVDWRAAGLEGFGKPTGYLERQLRRFTGLWDHNQTRELPTLEKVTAWLAEHRP